MVQQQLRPTKKWVRLIFFIKRFSQLKDGFKRLFTCTTCCEPLVKNENGEPAKIETCENLFPKENWDDCYTFLLPTEEQMQFFVKHHYGKRNKGNNKEDVRWDIHSGECYRKLLNEGIIVENSLTIKLNDDGDQKFKTSKYSFWQFMEIVNEAEYDIRRSKVIWMVLSYWNKKTPRSVLLNPVVRNQEKEVCSVVLQKIGPCGNVTSN